MTIVAVLVFQKNTEAFDFLGGNGAFNPDPLVYKEERYEDFDYLSGNLKEDATNVTVSEENGSAWNNRRYLAEVTSEDAGQKPNDWYMFIAIYFLISTLILLPICFLYVTSSKREKFGEKDFKKKYG